MLPVGPAPDVDDLTVKSGHRRFKRTALVALGTWNLLVLILLLAVVVERNTSEVGSAFKTLALLGVLDAFVLGNALFLVIGSVAWIAIRRHDRRGNLATA